MTAFSVNNPKMLTFIAPNLPAGVYTLRVTTQYAGSGKPYETPRTYTFPGVLTVPSS
jgi:hypothetical protein